MKRETTSLCVTIFFTQILALKPYIKDAYHQHLRKKSYEEATRPDRVSVLDRQRADAFDIREAALLAEAAERKALLKEAKKQRESEAKSLKPVSSCTLCVVIRAL